MIGVERVTTPAQWEAAQAIRFEVFVDEQQVPPELELDAYDATARHWLLTVDGAPVGTARVVEKPDGWKIGRVAVRLPARGQGLGLALMRAILAEGQAEGASAYYLDSQEYAIPFYERLGFVAEGERFMDAGIPHFHMRRAGD